MCVCVCVCVCVRERERERGREGEREGESENRQQFDAKIFVLQNSSSSSPFLPAINQSGVFKDASLRLTLFLAAAQSTYVAY